VGSISSRQAGGSHRPSQSLPETGPGNWRKVRGIDIEDDNPKKFMSIADAARFIEYVNEKLGKYPTVYVNYHVYNLISENYGKESVFAKTPLWVARFKNRLGDQNTSVWLTIPFGNFRARSIARRDRNACAAFQERNRICM
jgi:hypothetical protein